MVQDPRHDACGQALVQLVLALRHIQSLQKGLLLATLPP